MGNQQRRAIGSVEIRKARCADGRGPEQVEESCQEWGKARTTERALTQQPGV
jgi:hypothetical protein